MKKQNKVKEMISMRSIMLLVVTTILVVSLLVGCAECAENEFLKYETIHEAAEKGDLEDVERHLRRGVDTLGKVILNGRRVLQKDPEEEFCMLPQAMLHSLPVELSNLSAISDGTVHYVRSLLEKKKLIAQPAGPQRQTQLVQKTGEVDSKKAIKSEEGGITVSLQADPLSGNVPLEVTFRSSVSGLKEEDEVYYYFWWNCDHPGTDFGEFSDTCPHPAPYSEIGAYYSTIAARSMLTDTREHIYYAPATYTAKLLVVVRIYGEGKKARQHRKSGGDPIEIRIIERRITIRTSLPEMWKPLDFNKFISEHLPKYEKPKSLFKVPEHYDRISLAIRAAQDGDVIIVSPGVYREEVDFGGKKIMLRSIDPSNPTIVEKTVLEQPGSLIGGTGTGRGGCVVDFKSGESEEAVLAGFTIRYAAFGVWVLHSSPMIINNIITGNCNDYSGGCVGRGSGIYVEGDSSPTIINNFIIGNRSFGDFGGGGGIRIVGIDQWQQKIGVNATPIIKSNVIAFNEASRGGGINIWASSPIISHNIITFNKASSGGGIYCCNEGETLAKMRKTFPKIIDNTITDNNGSSNGGGIFNAGCVILSGNIFKKNTAKRKEKWGEGGAMFISGTILDREGNPIPPPFRGKDEEPNNTYGRGNEANMPENIHFE